jgi:hypothetical protein
MYKLLGIFLLEQYHRFHMLGRRTHSAGHFQSMPGRESGIGDLLLCLLPR